MKQSKSTINALKFHLTIFIFMWFVHFLNILTHYSLNKYGLLPRSISGLIGICTSPFLHGNLQHIVFNSLPFLILGGIIALGGLKIYLRVTILVILGGGILTWLFGRYSIHIGASGLIFGYLGYLVARGWFARKVSDMVISLGVIVFYGGMIWGVLPTALPISWEGHLFSLISGIIISSNKKRPTTRSY